MWFVSTSKLFVYFLSISKRNAMKKTFCLPYCRDGLNFHFVLYRNLNGSHMTSFIQSQSVILVRGNTFLFCTNETVWFIHSSYIQRTNQSSPSSRVESENNVTNRRPFVCKYSAFTNCEWHVVKVKFSICKITFYLSGLKNVCVQLCAVFFSSLVKSWPCQL